MPLYQHTKVCLFDFLTLQAVESDRRKLHHLNRELSRSECRVLISNTNLRTCLDEIILRSCPIAPGSSRIAPSDQSRKLDSVEYADAAIQCSEWKERSTAIGICLRRIRSMLSESEYCIELKGFSRCHQLQTSINKIETFLPPKRRVKWCSLTCRIVRSSLLPRKG